MQYVSSAKACLLFNLSPFITALFSYFFLSERMNKMKWLGLGIGLSGFIPVLLAQAPQEATSFNSVLGISLPELAVIVAVFSASYAWILIKRQVKKGYSPLMLNGIAMTWGGLLILATSFITEGAPSTSCCLASNDTIGTYFSHLVGSSEIGLYMFVFYTTLMVIVANFICYNLYGYLLRKYSATFLSFAGLTTPLFTALSGWLLLGEAVNTSFYLSICITFWGLFIFYKQEGKTSVA